MQILMQRKGAFFKVMEKHGWRKVFLYLLFWNSYLSYNNTNQLYSVDLLLTATTMKSLSIINLGGTGAYAVRASLRLSIHVHNISE